MKTFIVYTLVVVFCGATAVGISMANEQGVLELHWEWPNDRQPERTVTVVLSEVKKRGKGLFGIDQSPSLTSHYPDAMEVKGQVASGPDVNKRILLVMPGRELPANLKAEEVVHLLLLDNKTCIGIERAR